MKVNTCLTDKEDVREGAKIFEHNGEKYAIIKGE